LPGKKYKLDVKVDVDGDGQYDDKAFVVQHRPFYTTKKARLLKRRARPFVSKRFLRALRVLLGVLCVENIQTNTKR
jgi:hypothetical protein